MRRWTALACLVLTATSLAADTPTAPFTYPTAVQAWNRYQFRANKAREAFEREMASIKAEYNEALKPAAQIVAKSGNAAEMARIAEAQEAVTSSSHMTQFRGRRYVYVPVEVTWHQANEICRRFGGSLAKVHSYSPSRLHR